MSRVIVNLTLPIVIEAIENALELYPQHPHREIFAIPDARQDLLAYILSRFPNSYTVMDEREQPFSCLHIPHCTQEQRIQLEALVHQGIQYFAQEHAEVIQHQTPEPMDLECMPSTWFG